MLNISKTAIAIAIMFLLSASVGVMADEHHCEWLQRACDTHGGDACQRARECRHHERCEFLRTACERARDEGRHEECHRYHEECR